MDQQFSLSWNNFHGNLSKGFAGLLGNGEFVDVTIAVEGHLLQAHKVILSICSPYFKKMFQLNPCQHPIVVLRDVTHKAMRDLLQFMYHGEVSVKREDLTSFIGTAEVLQIKGLTNNNKETDEDDSEKDQENPKKNLLPHENLTDTNHMPEQIETSNHEDVNQNNSLQIIKQREFIEKLHRLSNLKRKSEEFLQKNYYSDILNTDKKPKLKDKPTYNKISNHLLHSNSYENIRKVYDDNPGEMNTYSTEMNKPSDLRKDLNENKDHPMSDNSIELKTECDDSDIIVTDPAVCTTPKSYEARDGQRESSTPIDYSPQDNCSSLNSLFVDLKKIANGKVSTNILRPVTDDFLRNSAEHRLVTIPQKEDGKKKYPQRSCRLCWKIGRRRDTRFMCSACEMPFCKSPCFGIHYNDILKLSQLQGDYYAA